MTTNALEKRMRKEVSLDLNDYNKNNGINGRDDLVDNVDGNPSAKVVAVHYSLENKKNYVNVVTCNNNDNNNYNKTTASEYHIIDKNNFEKLPTGVEVVFFGGANEKKTDYENVCGDQSPIIAGCHKEESRHDINERDTKSTQPNKAKNDEEKNPGIVASTSDRYSMVSINCSALVLLSSSGKQKPVDQNDCGGEEHKTKLEGSGNHGICEKNRQQQQEDKPMYETRDDYSKRVTIVETIIRDFSSIDSSSMVNTISSATFSDEHSDKSESTIDDIDDAELEDFYSECTPRSDGMVNIVLGRFFCSPLSAPSDSFSDMDDYGYDFNSYDDGYDSYTELTNSSCEPIDKEDVWFTGRNNDVGGTRRSRSPYVLSRKRANATAPKGILKKKQPSTDDGEAIEASTALITEFNHDQAKCHPEDIPPNVIETNLGSIDTADNNNGSISSSNDCVDYVDSNNESVDEIDDNKKNQVIGSPTPFGNGGNRCHRRKLLLSVMRNKNKNKTKAKAKTKDVLLSPMPSNYSNYNNKINAASTNTTTTMVEEMSSDIGTEIVAQLQHDSSSATEDNDSLSLVSLPPPGSCNLGTPPPPMKRVPLEFVALCMAMNMATIVIQTKRNKRKRNEIQLTNE